MSDDSDDDFDMGVPAPSRRGGNGQANKGKGRAIPKPSKNATATRIQDLDDLLAASKLDVRMKEKRSELMDLGDNLFDMDLQTEEAKARTEATAAKDRADNAAIMADNSIIVPGVIRVFRPSQGQAAPVELCFDAPCPRKELKVLFQALQRLGSDPEELVELLRVALVPWVREKLDGEAPREVCAWLLRIVARHESATAALAAEETLHELLLLSSERGDSNMNDKEYKGWRLRYEDTLAIWRGCGALWLAEGNNKSGVGGEHDEEDEEEEEDEVEDVIQCLGRNLRPALDVVEACLRAGQHELSNDELREMLLDLSAAALDQGVSGCCQTEVYGVLEAVVDAVPANQYGDEEWLFSLVDGLCDPRRRGLESRMTLLSFALLVRNVPYHRHASSGLGGEGGTDGSGGGGGGAAGSASLSLRHEVCHRLLSTRFLSNTSYVTEGSSPGFGRAIKALEVLLDDEDDLLNEDSQEGYERQYVVVALANEMAAATLALSRSGRPDPGLSKTVILLSDRINKKMVDVMQPCVQMSKTLLDLMKSKYTPFLASSSGRQSTLSFRSVGGGGGSGNGSANESAEMDADDDDGDEDDDGDKGGD